MPFTTHDAYFASVDADARQRLLQIQAEVERRVPGAVRCIGYAMPAFRYQRIFLYFAAFKKHIGIYPPVRGDAALRQALAPYRGEKGKPSFPLAEAIPYELIRRVARQRMRENASRAPGRRTK